MLLYNAQIFVDGEEYEYMLIRANRIEKIGKGNLPSSARKIDLKDATILPGFCDTHTHLSNIALMHGTLDLTNKSREDVLNLVKEECKKRDMVVGRGWDESFWNKKEYITKEELDNACKDKIVLLIREDGHLGVINSYAEREFSITSENGVIKENELEKILKKLAIGNVLDFNYAQDYALSKGVTCVHDFTNIRTFKEYMRLHKRGELKIRIYANFYSSAYKIIKKLGFYSGYGDSFLRIGALKLFADGSIGAKTAATEYVDGTKIKPMLYSKRLKGIVKEANSLGIRVFTHAIGDYAIDEVLNAYRETRGNRIEHFELVRDEHLNKLDGISLSMQPNFLKWAKKGGLYHRMLGEKWLHRNNPYRNIIDTHRELLFGSDCMPLDPLFGIKLAVNSEYEAQRISVDEAIRAYTKGAKYFGEKFGEIREGNIADIVVIKGDLQKISNAQVFMTIVDGKIRYTSQ